MASDATRVSMRHVRVLRRRQRHADDRHDARHGEGASRLRPRACPAATLRTVREPAV